MIAILLPPAFTKLDTTCHDCEDGAVMLGAGTPWEQMRKCRTCSGTGTVEISRCETCSHVVSDSEIDDWGICDVCFAAGNEALDRETLEYGDGVMHPEVAYGMAQGWL